MPTNEDWASKKAAELLPHFLLGADGANDWHPESCPCRYQSRVAQALREERERAAERMTVAAVAAIPQGEKEG